MVSCVLGTQLLMAQIRLRSAEYVLNDSLASKQAKSLMQSHSIVAVRLANATALRTLPVSAAPASAAPAAATGKQASDAVPMVRCLLYRVAIRHDDCSRQRGSTFTRSAPRSAQYQQHNTLSQTWCSGLVP